MNLTRLALGSVAVGAGALAALFALWALTGGDDAVFVTGYAVIIVAVIAATWYVTDWAKSAKR